MSEKNSKLVLRFPSIAGSISNSSPAVAKVPRVQRNESITGILHFKMEGDRILPGAWCSNCRNGGEVVICVICETNSICTECIDFNLKNVNVEEMQFECPACFSKKEGAGKYPFVFSRNSSTRQRWPTILTTPLAIISIHLEGMKDIPSVIAYHHIHPWLLGNLVHVDLDFDFGKVDDFTARLNMMLDRFEKGDLMDFSRFFIFITTHSDPNTGFLHVSPLNGGSMPVREVLKRSDSNVLTFFACGALSTYEESRNAMSRFATRDLFRKIFCFSQIDFQTFFAHSFVMDFALQYFIYDRTNLVPILRDQQELGAHTDVIEFQPEKTSTFRWTHHGSRPMGFGFVDQCATCHHLKTLRPIVIENNAQIALKCSNCKVKTTYRLPIGWSWVNNPPMKGDERGAWLVHVDLHKGGVMMDTT